jgi:membrane protein YdbS with pleckstrin-like domain
MSYVDAVLQPGERVKAVGRLHWVIFFRAILLAAVGFGLLAAAREVAPQIRDMFVIAAGIVLVLALLAFLQAWVRRSITELAVTDHRVIYKRGFLRRHTVEMNMDKVETVDVDQTVMGRLLGFGSIRVRGTGQGFENLRRIGSPVQLRNAITAR